MRGVNGSYTNAVEEDPGERTAIPLQPISAALTPLRVRPAHGCFRSMCVTWPWS